MIEVCLLGTGGMMPLPGRALTSLYVCHDGHALLIDCGEGTQTAIRAASLGFAPIEAIAITHFHADHISGLPGLLLALGDAGRNQPLHMYGPEGLEQIVNAMRVLAPELPYAIVYHEFERRSAAGFSCAGLRLTAFPLDHGMTCFGYQIELSTPERDVALLYATDSRPVPAMEEYGKGADLLILEGMFGEEEKRTRALESHHMLMTEAAQIADRAGAKELWLTHFSPANPEPEAFLEDVQKIFSNTVIGQAGMMKTWSSCIDM